MTTGVARLVEVMDTLRSSDGCDWDQEQTHESLTKYLVEETFELVDAIEHGNRPHIREELGDVLLQVVFHARIAQEHPTDPWDFDAVAQQCADKLVARHPHVFGDAQAPEGAKRRAQWEDNKAQEKSRVSVMDGIPGAQPALARAQKVLARAAHAGVAYRAPAGIGIGHALLEVVAQAEAQGHDAETELRRVTRDLESAIREAETTLDSAQVDPVPSD